MSGTPKTNGFLSTETHDFIGSVEPLEATLTRLLDNMIRKIQIFILSGLKPNFR